MPDMDLCECNCGCPRTPTKPIHGAPKRDNVPSDMQCTPPVPCDFAVGDAVIFTNDYGVEFPAVVRGFARQPHGIEGDRFVYLRFVNPGAWWFPHRPQSLRHVPQPAPTA